METQSKELRATRLVRCVGLISLLTTAACALTPEQAQRMTTTDLCARYLQGLQSIGSAPVSEAELQKRGQLYACQAAGRELAQERERELRKQADIAECQAAATRVIGGPTQSPLAAAAGQTVTGYYNGKPFSAQVQPDITAILKSGGVSGHAYQEGQRLGAIQNLTNRCLADKGYR